MTAAIQTEGLTKRYGTVLALDGLDLEVAQGEVFGFLGPNGAGKTTTIRLLLDLIRPTAGRAEVLGHDVRAESVELRRRVGYLPGELDLSDRISAMELATWYGDLHGGADRSRIESLAERLGLDPTREVRQLSKGNRQKVGIVLAFAHAPELLILDEPTGGLDPLVQQEFLQLVRETASEGRTVFLSSHVLAEVQHVADRVAIIRSGRLVAIEGVRQLAERAQRWVRIQFASPVPSTAFEDLEGVGEIHIDGDVLRCVVEGSMDRFLKAVAQYEVLDLTSEQPDLETLFLRFYRDDDDVA